MNQLQFSHICKKKQRSLGYCDAVNRSTASFEYESSERESSASSSSSETNEISETKRVQTNWQQSGRRKPANDADDRSIDDLFKANNASDINNHQTNDEELDVPERFGLRGAASTGRSCSISSSSGHSDSDQSDSGELTKSIQTLRIEKPTAMKPKKHLIERLNHDNELQQRLDHPSASEHIDSFKQYMINENRFSAQRIGGSPSSFTSARAAAQATKFIDHNGQEGMQLLASTPPFIEPPTQGQSWN